jgi:hypothetical protein
MHGRHKTVRNCINRMPFVDIVMIYSTDEDGEFLQQFPNVIATAQVQNTPLSFKWNQAIKSLSQIEFDAVILLGSDDYIDEAFLQFVHQNMDCDMIGFYDIYFKADRKTYYWEGYQNNRKGEPSGAGRVYSKQFLESIGYNLYPTFANKGLDGIAWKVVKSRNASVKLFSLKENDLMLCDVKDGEGMNSIEKLFRLIDLKEI